MQYGFFYDQTRCIDCRACSVACRDWNDIEPGPVKWLRRFTWETGAFPEVRTNFLFAPCYHCETPLCLEACPNGAIYKEDKYGAVLVDPARCTGTRQCWVACPYGAPQFAGERPGTKMSKCNMCIDRLERGEMPICVLSCPTRALDFGPIEELRRKYGKIAAIEGMPDPTDTDPAVVFRPQQKERAKVVPYDAQRAIELFADRDPQPPLYDDLASLLQPVEGIQVKNRLVMKPDTMEELQNLTRNDEG